MAATSSVAKSTVAVVVVWPVSRPGTRYSISAISPASVARTITVMGCVNQPVEEAGVVAALASTGGTLSPIVVSMVIVSVCHGDSLPAPSMMRVSSSCEPPPVIVAMSPSARETMEPPSIRHWTDATSE